MSLNQNTKPSKKPGFLPGTLVKFTVDLPILSYGLTENGKLPPSPKRIWHEFSSSSTGMFISPSSNLPRTCGIVLVDDKLLYVNYDEIAELTQSP